MLYYAGEHSQYNIYKCDLTFFASVFMLPFPVTGLEYFIGKGILFFVAKVLPFIPERNLCENRCKKPAAFAGCLLCFQLQRGEYTTDKHC